MKRILMMAAALSLLTAPAAMAQHRHQAQGQHAGARHTAKPHRANRSRPAVRRSPARARNATRTHNRHAARAGARRVTHQRRATRGAYRTGRNRHVAGRYHGSNRNHWRHAQRVGRWGRGYRLPRSYWGGRQWVNWRSHRLWAPPYGYQWVYVDGDYVLMAVATGLIADIVIGNSYY
jgi:Ni/Co efflux regulator RcnB